MTNQAPQSNRRDAWHALFKLLEGVRYQGPEPRPSVEEEEHMVDLMVRRWRRARLRDRGEDA